VYSRIELWTNDSDSEFAIIAKSNILAKTAESNFTRSIDKSTFERNKIYNWNLMIHKWITFYFSNKYIPELANEWGQSKIRFLPVGTSDKRVRPRIKCNFCGLKFYGVYDRQEHEVTWHPGKFVNKQ
jgi:hypothetical protein